MKKRFLVLLLICVQCFVPSMMIASQEKILTEGEVFKFKTAPVDPYDIFRGRYVALSTDQRSVKVQHPKTFNRKQNVYVVLGIDEDGFAYIVDAKHERPELNSYIKTKVKYVSGKIVHFSLPLNRYYMNEEKAPQAEVLYRKKSRAGKKDAYISVRVLDGKALIEGLYVEDKPIESFL